MRLIDADALEPDADYDDGEYWAYTITQIENAPTIEPKKGRWIEKSVFYKEGDTVIEGWQSARCSVCGRYHTTPYMYYFNEYKYCPNCGADMRGEQRWIPVTERLPETDNEVLITVLDAEDDYVEVYKGFYQDHEWWTQWCHGCLKIKDEPCGVNIVTAWMPLPEPYKEEGADG